jgi:hypothetical protein
MCFLPTFGVRAAPWGLPLVLGRRDAPRLVQQSRAGHEPAARRRSRGTPFSPRTYPRSPSATAARRSSASRMPPVPRFAGIWGTDEDPVPHSASEIAPELGVFRRCDRLTVIPEMAKHAGQRLAIIVHVSQVLEYGRSVKTARSIHILEGLHCTGATAWIATPCDRACASVWHEERLVLEPQRGGPRPAAAPPAGDAKAAR